MADRLCGVHRPRKYVGSELLATLRETHTSVGDILDALEECDHIDLGPSVVAAATLGGVTEDAYEFYIDEILSTIHAAAKALNGIVFSPHDVGTLLSVIREAVGFDMPMVASHHPTECYPRDGSHSRRVGRVRFAAEFWNMREAFIRPFSTSATYLAMCPGRDSWRPRDGRGVLIDSGDNPSSGVQAKVVARQ